MKGAPYLTICLFDSAYFFFTVRNQVRTINEQVQSSLESNVQVSNSSSASVCLTAMLCLCDSLRSDVDMTECDSTVLWRRHDGVLGLRREDEINHLTGHKHHHSLSLACQQEADVCAVFMLSLKLRFLNPFKYDIFCLTFSGSSLYSNS